MKTETVSDGTAARSAESKGARKHSATVAFAPMRQAEGPAPPRIASFEASNRLRIASASAHSRRPGSVR